MVEPPQSPDEAVFREHLDAGPFQSGVDRGRWRLLGIDWPYAVIEIGAAKREGGPTAYAFRFELTDYPQAPPTAQPWDAERETHLVAAAWPGGGQRLQLAFNPNWKNGQCLYLPCDRLAVEGHDGWRNQHPEMIWSSSGDITQYLRILHDYLNSGDYSGPRSA